MNANRVYLRIKSFQISIRKLTTQFELNFNSKAQNLKVYNSLTKQKEELELKNKNVLYWYSCGPTVYDSAHIGHAW